MTYKEIQEKIDLLTVEKNLQLKKDLHSDDPETILKASNYLKEISKKSKKDALKTIQTSGNLSLYRDNGYYNQKGKFLDDNTLRGMSKTSIISPIIKHYVTRTSSYMRYAQDKYDQGFIIKPKTSLFEDAKITDKHKRDIEVIYNFLENCGKESNHFFQEGLHTFHKKLVNDSLILDSAGFEKSYNRSQNEFLLFKHTDGATIRYAECYNQIDNVQRYAKNKFGYYPVYTQVIDQQPKAFLYPNEFTYLVRNPSSEIDSFGYGQSEIQYIATVIADWINLHKYNSREFQSLAPRGFLVAKDSQDEQQAGELTDTLHMIASGVDHAHNTVSLDGSRFEWVSLEKKRDMNFQELAHHLVRVCCATYRVAPENIGFPLEGAKGGNMGASAKGQQYEESDKSGLFPLLRQIQPVYNDIVKTVSDGAYCFEYQIPEENKLSELERLAKEVRSFKTINEVRRELGMEDIEEGNTILDPKMIELGFTSIQTELEEEQRKEDSSIGKSVLENDSQFSKELEDSLTDLFS